MVFFFKCQILPSLNHLYFAVSESSASFLGPSTSRTLWLFSWERRGAGGKGRQGLEGLPRFGTGRIQPSCAPACMGPGL